jgi:cytochrome c
MNASIRGAACAFACTLFAMAGPSMADDELAAAKKLALNHCGVCHTFEAGEAVRQGPNLWGVMTRGAGTVEGFAYSDSFRKALGGKRWDATLLDRWLTDPQAVAAGTVMLYKQDDPDKRALLIRFLESLQ